MLKTYFVADFRYENDVKFYSTRKDKLPTLRQFRFGMKRPIKRKKSFEKKGESKIRTRGSGSPWNIRW